jgi:DNA polymerase III epsilon subunit-like protein
VWKMPGLQLLARVSNVALGMAEEESVQIIADGMTDENPILHDRLKILAEEFLGIKIQEGAHSSVEDARATMALYRRI